MNIEKLAFFDFDFTLAMTSECVRVWSPRGTRIKNDKKYISINPTEFNVLKLADDEVIDDSSFEEFSKVDLTMASPIEPVLDYMRLFLSDETNAVKIVSARPQAVEPYVQNFLKSQNIGTSLKIDFKGCSSSDPSLKYDYVKKQIAIYNPKKVFFFDDSHKVMKYFTSSFRKDYNEKTKFVFCLVASNINEKTLIFKTM